MDTHIQILEPLVPSYIFIDMIGEVSRGQYDIGSAFTYIEYKEEGLYVYQLQPCVVIDRIQQVTMHFANLVASLMGEMDNQTLSSK